MRMRRRSQVLRRAVALGSVALLLGAMTPAAAVDEGHAHLQRPSIGASRSLETASAADRAMPLRVTLAFTGDFLATHATWEAARRYAGGSGYDYRPMLARLRPIVSSVDVAICHLETPLTGKGVALSDYPRYAVPHQLAYAIRRAGYEGCSTASNHSLDRGAAGIRTTLGWLDRVGLGHTGTARSAHERWKTTHYLVGNVKIAHLSFTGSFNGLVPSEPWRANRTDLAQIVEDARRARRRGADIVVLSLHWGPEHQHVPVTEQRNLAHQLLRSGAIDLIVGHHAHVVQTIRRPEGHWVAYGLGNSLSGMTAAMFSPGVQDGMVLLVVFERGAHGWHVDKVRYSPTWVEPYRWVVRVIGPALEARRLPAWVLDQLRASWRRTVGYVDAKRLGVLPIRRSRW
jgi:poly-gamma-glutamate synthesis protein (capsule biosynthesis protein)